MLSKLEDLKNTPRTLGQQKELLQKSGYVDVECPFLDYNFGNDPRGIHGATPAELLHLIYLGMVKDVVQLTFAALKRCVPKHKLQDVVGKLSSRLKDIPSYRAKNVRTRKFASGTFNSLL